MIGKVSSKLNIGTTRCCYEFSLFEVIIEDESSTGKTHRKRVNFVTFGSFLQAAIFGLISCFWTASINANVIKDFLSKNELGSNYNSVSKDNYEFGYYVEDPEEQVSFGQLESKGKYGDTVGLYEVLQPNGLNRLVKYSAAEGKGFEANVTYDNQGGGFVYQNM